MGTQHDDNGEREQRSSRAVNHQGKCKGCLSVCTGPCMFMVRAPPTRHDFDMSKALWKHRRLLLSISIALSLHKRKILRSLFCVSIRALRGAFHSTTDLMILLLHQLLTWHACACLQYVILHTHCMLRQCPALRFAYLVSCQALDPVHGTHHGA